MLTKPQLFLPLSSRLLGSQACSPTAEISSSSETPGKASVTQRANQSCVLTASHPALALLLPLGERRRRFS